MNQEIKEIFDLFIKKRSSIEISIPEMKRNMERFFGKIVLYGAGSAGIAFLHYLRDVDIYPQYFVDGDPNKWGSTVEGLEVISPEQVVARVTAEALVIVTINTDGKRYCKSFAEALRQGGHSGVHQRLLQAGCIHTIDYTYFRRCHALFQKDPYNLPACSDVQLMLEHQLDISAAYELLSDDKSREIFRKILYFRLIDDSIEIPTLSQDEQYFEYDLYRPIQNECFIDCGAFNGITLKKFLSNNGASFVRYVAIEPDDVNYVALQQYVQTLPQAVQQKVQLYPYAAGERTGEAKLYRLKGPGSFMAADIGTQRVVTDSIDHMLQDREATMIKMNIEGSELKALEGASQTIKRYKPVLAISAYHKTWDLWSVPLYVSSLLKDYQYILRSYMNHVVFVYYIIPANRQR